MESQMEEPESQAQAMLKAGRLPEAKALHALETILAIHLGALEEAVNAEAKRDLSI